jgi:transcription elongation factor GreA
MPLINLGSRVKVNINGKIRDFEIVDTSQIEPSQGRISPDSAIGKALLGCCGGEVKQVKTPSGEIIELKVESIDG